MVFDEEVGNSNVVEGSEAVRSPHHSEFLSHSPWPALKFRDGGLVLDWIRAAYAAASFFSLRLPIPTAALPVPVQNLAGGPSLSPWTAGARGPRSMGLSYLIRFQMGLKLCKAVGADIYAVTPFLPRLARILPHFVRASDDWFEQKRTNVLDLCLLVAAEFTGGFVSSLSSKSESLEPKRVYDLRGHKSFIGRVPRDMYPQTGEMCPLHPRKLMRSIPLPPSAPKDGHLHNRQGRPDHETRLPFGYPGQRFAQRAHCLSPSGGNKQELAREPGFLTLVCVCMSLSETKRVKVGRLKQRLVCPMRRVDGWMGGTGTRLQISPDWMNVTVPFDDLTCIP
ncbi:uncharacterized protein CLUP02_04125 [Colletotrichum lupini]|uniref:Uncharacterized protein n=1 Tax=Colletotrichum lupini TaxID=145971 RepID=A0A9Q8SK76_9PEZI|nr:uncharacterized protein CLUP02_04125 [Colletotrichum lupini]UQC78648.1 hypothetical protein CLUP02_04125 [Colletotrichum lupini]